MKRRSRALWLPALEVLLPGAFIAGLALEWLPLERETARRRGEAAAHDAVASLDRALAARLVAAAPQVEAALRGRAAGQPPFLLPPMWPNPVSSAFLFDAHSQLVGPASARDQLPNADDAREGSGKYFQAGSRSPHWSCRRGRVTRAADPGRSG